MKNRFAGTLALGAALALLFPYISRAADFKAGPAESRFAVPVSMGFGPMEFPAAPASMGFGSHELSAALQSAVPASEASVSVAASASSDEDLAALLSRVKRLGKTSRIKIDWQYFPLSVGIWDVRVKNGRVVVNAWRSLLEQVVLVLKKNLSPEDYSRVSVINDGFQERLAAGGGGARLIKNGISAVKRAGALAGRIFGKARAPEAVSEAPASAGPVSPPQDSGRGRLLSMLERRGSPLERTEGGLVHQVSLSYIPDLGQVLTLSVHARPGAEGGADIEVHVNPATGEIIDGTGMTGEPRSLEAGEADAFARREIADWLAAERWIFADYGAAAEFSGASAGSALAAPRAVSPAALSAQDLGAGSLGLNPAAPSQGDAPAQTASGPDLAAVDAAGYSHPLAYDPGLKEPLPRIAWRTLRRLPEKMRRVRAYFKRASEIVNDIPDEDLTWSLARLNALKSQEGILRSDNAHLVDKWKFRGEYIRQLSPADFAESSLDEASLVRPFKEGMDKEAPTLQFQFTSAHNLHNHLPRVSHFMGWTMQEYMLAVALKGIQGQQAIWAMEEVRHGPILERVYNAVKNPRRPPLEQQGISSKQPVWGAYSARSMMANRALAEFAAASAYLLIRANAKKDSPTDKVLDGIFRDEAYHYVIMAAVNKFVYGHHSRWRRIASIVRHTFDYPTPKAKDRVVYDRKLVSPLLAVEILHAFNVIDKRIDRYLRTLSPETVKDWIGEVYPTDEAAAAAVERGEHTWTPIFRSEQNPELTYNEVAELEQRFPGKYLLSERRIKESDVRKTIQTYRERSLSNPKYWMRKKGFAYADSSRLILERALEKSPGAFLRLSFSGELYRAPVFSVVEKGAQGEKILFSSPLDKLSMLQIGAIMDAQGLEVIGKIEKSGPDLSPEELVKRLNRSPAYQKNPLRLERD